LFTFDLEAWWLSEYVLMNIVFSVIPTSTSRWAATWINCAEGSVSSQYGWQVQVNVHLHRLCPYGKYRSRK